MVGPGVMAGGAPLAPYAGGAQVAPDMLLVEDEEPQQLPPRFVWESPVFPVQQADELQSFQIEPTLCVGGLLQVCGLPLHTTGLPEHALPHANSVPYSRNCMEQGQAWLSVGTVWHVPRPLLPGTCRHFVLFAHVPLLRAPPIQQVCLAAACYRWN